MRRFSSYGPIDKDLYYYAPRQELIHLGYSQLVGENPTKGGHYFTVWAPRQCGKTWVMQQVVQQIKQTDEYCIAIISMQAAKDHLKEKKVVEILLNKLTMAFNIQFPKLNTISDIASIFSKQYFPKPLILIIDEFDALEEQFINAFANIFRDIYIDRINQPDKTSNEKNYILHGLALIGVRSVLGIENVKGSPFNIQRSLKVPNLTLKETVDIFHWYEKESGQVVQPEVVEALYKETNGQPGLTCWLGELLTEGYENYTNDYSKPITMREFADTYGAASHILPNNNILNLISKAKEPENKTLLMEIFQTWDKLEFNFDDKITNALYMNGLIEYEKTDDGEYYIKFSCPFVQKRIFSYFAREYFKEVGRGMEPMMLLSDIITPDHLDIIGIVRLYQKYLDKNKSWMFSHVPRRSDQRIYEAVFHFNFFAYLRPFLRGININVLPEFPTGNGKIDLLIRYRDKLYGIELKSFRDDIRFQQAIGKAASYGKQLGLTEIYLVTFIEFITEEMRAAFEKPFLVLESGVTVKPVFIQIGLL